MKTYFQSLSQEIFKSLSKNENIFLSWIGDDTQFVRFNAAKVRQTGIVENHFLEFTFVLGDAEGSLRKAAGEITLTLNLSEDLSRMNAWIKRFRSELYEFPVDPYASLPKNTGVSQIDSLKGELLPRDQAIEKILSPFSAKVDVAGIYAAGSVYRGLANSAGLFHWFETETFSWDYSLYNSSQRAVKSTYSGTHHDHDKYLNDATRSIEQLEMLGRTPKKLARGSYRAYLAPGAVGEIIGTMAWGALSEFSIRKNQSALRLIRSGEKNFSEKFNLIEDYSGGETPRFNREGDLAPVSLTLIENGKLKSTLIHSRTAKEYKIDSNGADSTESLRSACVLGGALRESEILERLDTGLYLSNLHYLNWSDQVNGRLTGMTRFACFWVEKGRIVSPIENMRFDETIFDFFGSSLEEFTQDCRYLAENHTYSYRRVGGMKVPGALLSEMRFTL